MADRPTGPVRIAGLRRRAGTAAFGLAAQGMTFAALFLPVLFGLSGTLVILVQASAIASVLVQSAVLASEARLPTMTDERRARTTVVSALLCLGFCVVVLETVGVCATVAGAGWAPIVLSAGALLLGQGLYTVRLAHLTRALDVRAIMRTRMVYGVVVFGSTLLFCLLTVPAEVFVLGNAAAFVCATLFAGLLPLRPHARNIRADRLGALALWRETTAASPLALAYLLGGFSGQAGALSVGLLGPLAPAWAVICRIMGGVQTVGGQLFGPVVDVGVAGAVQGTDIVHLRRSVRRGAYVGATLALASVAASGVALWWVRELPTSTEPTFPLIVVGILGFAVPNVFLAPIARTLGMIGRARVRISWDVARFILLGAAVLLLRDGPLLVAISSITLVTTLTYVALVLAYTRRIDDVIRGVSVHPEVDRVG